MDEDGNPILAGDEERRYNEDGTIQTIDPYK
jgi:hypothetical protein